MSELSIGVMGAGGRMGRALVRAITDADGCRVAGGIERAGHADLGKDLGLLAGLEPLNLSLAEDSAALIDYADAIVDFTAPDATAANVVAAADAGTIHIIGTTGLEPHHQAAIDQAASRIAIVQAANYSLGVNLSLALTELAAKVLDDAFDIEIIEMHHNQKVDAPSGTALALGLAAAAGRGVDLDAVSDRGRDGITGARKRGDIGFAVLRGGNVPGDHTVVFAGTDERIEITHKAQDRMIFARGAVHAAKWAKAQPPGLYAMRDVLGL